MRRRILIAAFDQVPTAQRDRKWAKGKGDVGRWVRDAYNRSARKRGTFFREFVTYLEDDPLWRGAIRFNRFAQTIEVSDPFPPQPGQVINSYRALRDPVDILEALLVVQENGFPKAGRDTVTNAIVLVAERHSYHPVQDWLDGLVWDGQERLDRLFLDYFPGELPDEAENKARDEIVAFYEQIARCFLVGAVARIFRPGCKVDCLPVLVSPQGFFKSRGLGALVPDTAWYSDDLSTYLIDKDTKESLGGKWIIELSEFPHVKKDVEKVKAFFSRGVRPLSSSLRAIECRPPTAMHFLCVHKPTRAR